MLNDIYNNNRRSKIMTKSDYIANELSVDVSYLAFRTETDKYGRGNEIIKRYRFTYNAYKYCIEYKNNTYYLNRMGFWNERLYTETKTIAKSTNFVQIVETIKTII